MSLPLEGSRDTEEGILVSIYPDVCLTPCGSSMVPVPYTIWAKQSDDANTTPTVRFTSLRTHNMGSLITTCHGDEAGTGGGVKSGTHNGVCEPLEHSSKVRAEGKNSIRHNDLWWMNNKNTQGRLTYVKESDKADLTPHSQQGWKVADMSAKPSPDSKSFLALAPSVGFLAPQAAPATAGGAALAGAGEVATGVGAGEAAAGAGAAGLGWLLAPLAAGVVLLWPSSTGGKRRADGTYEDEMPRQPTAAPLPVGRTDANVNVSSKPKEDRPCRAGRYGSLNCEAGEQAHHIVADYTLRYGTRAEGIAGEKRIPGLPSFNDGPAVCLQGYSKTAGDEHNIAHEADGAIAALGGEKGSAPIGQITKISVASAIKARPKCAKEIVAAVAAQPSLIGGAPARTTINPPGKWPP